MDKTKTNSDPTPTDEDAAEKRAYNRPVLKSTEAFEKLALQSCSTEDKFPLGVCAET